MKSWDVVTTVTYAIDAETDEEAIALVDSYLEGDTLTWSTPIAIEEEN